MLRAFETRLAAASLVLGAASCTGEAPTPVEDGDTANPPAAGAPAPGAEVPGTGAEGAPDTGVPGTTGPNGEWIPQPLADEPPVSPVLRLRQAEYTATVATAFPDVSLPGLELPTDGTDGVFTTNAFDLLSEFRAYVDTAERLAGAVSGSLIPKCDWETQTEDCIRAELLPSLEMLYRRSLTEEEVALQAGRIRAGLEREAPIDVALTGALAETFLDFRFLFRQELGGGPSPSVATAKLLTDEELAARLSYTLTGTPPDAELRALVASGELPVQLATQVGRLFETPEAEAVIWSFVSDWLALPKAAPEDDGVMTEPPPAEDECNSTGQCQDVYGDQATDCVDSSGSQSWCNCGGERCAAPAPPAEAKMGLMASAYEETRRFVSHVLLSGDVPLSELLTANYSFINSTLAEHYGVPAPATDWERYEFEPSAQRMGILTQALFLTANGREERDISWIFRGRVIYERLFCGRFIGLPAAGTTDRETISRLETPECAACHLKMDPVGQMFDIYGSHGEVVPSTVTSFQLSAGSDVDGEYTGLTEFLGKAATSQALEHCFANMWFRYALGRSAVSVDQSTHDSSVETIRGGSAKQALAGLFETEAFQTVHQTEAQCQ